jgi:hypothetical protein
MTEIVHPQERTAKEIISQYGPQTKLFLEFGKKWHIFTTVEDQGVSYYTHLRAVQALAYIIDYAYTHYPDAAHGLLESLYTPTPSGIDALYPIFLEIYERDLQDPQHAHGTSLEQHLCATELARIQKEKEQWFTGRPYGPQHFFHPTRFTTMVDQLGHPHSKIYTTPFDQLLQQTQDKMLGTSTQQEILKTLTDTPKK